MRVGVIGCGAISNVYFKNLTPFSEFTQITTCADSHLECAREMAASRLPGLIPLTTL
jgi:predicted dehydrogenase